MRCANCSTSTFEGCLYPIFYLQVERSEFVRRSLEQCTAAAKLHSGLRGALSWKSCDHLDSFRNERGELRSLYFSAAAFALPNGKRGMFAKLIEQFGLLKFEENRSNTWNRDGRVVMDFVCSVGRHRRFFAAGLRIREKFECAGVRQFLVEKHGSAR